MRNRGGVARNFIDFKRVRGHGNNRPFLVARNAYEVFVKQFVGKGVVHRVVDRTRRTRAHRRLANGNKYARDVALEILEYAREHDCTVLLPLDKGVAKEFARDAVRTNKDFTKIEEDDIIIDAGVATTERDVNEIKHAKTVIWNGTVGMAEWAPRWSYGSFALANAIAEQTRNGVLESVVGGGDTVAALTACGVKDDITYVSTGGGAFLEFIEGRILPGIAILEDK